MDGRSSPARGVRACTLIVRVRSPVSSLFVAWTLLDLLFNVRFPDLQPPALYFLPSVDVTVLLAGVAVVVWRGWRVPAAAVWGLAAVVVLVRAFRVADGVVWRYFNRPIDLGLDMPTAGAMVHLLRTTVAWPILLGVVLLLAGCAFGFAAMAAWALRTAERAFAAQQHRRLFGAVVAFAVLMSPLLPADPTGDLRAGVFAPTLVFRVADEIRRIGRLDEYRRAEDLRVRRTAARLQAAPRDLARAGQTDVLLFFIESYGATVIDRPEHWREIEPVYRRLDAQLEEHGFLVASSLLASPTYGGRSQLAHQALATGIRADNRINDELVQALRPRTMARVFRDHGYRTVLVMPGNTQRGMFRWVYDFERVYSSWDLGYRGPLFAFDAMPDQFVIDVIHRREVGSVEGPLFVQYALESSHAPWDRQPEYIEDWSQVGDGSIFARLPPVRFATNWSNLHHHPEAYARSIVYDLRVLADYLTRFDLGDALVIALGDHQPVADITGKSGSAAVPVHVITRQRPLVDAFRVLGYSDGLRPPALAAPPGMETFRETLLGILSR